MHILLLSGSFHKKSYSQALLKLIKEILGNDHKTTNYPIDSLHFYSEDLTNSNRPDNVKDFIKLVGLCDAIIVCTPEYNHSIPAVLKNAIDWASRPAFNSPLKGKPVTIFTQAPSPVGGARAQAHLKLVLDSTLAIIYPSHEQMIASIDKKFDEELTLTDGHTRVRIQRHVSDFIDWVHQIKQYPT